MEIKKPNNMAMIMLDIIAVVLMLLYFVPALSYRAFYIVLSVAATLFAYHNSKNPISLIIMIIGILFLVYVLFTGSYYLLYAW